MSDIRQHSDAAVPRRRQAGGVVGYVAELQQFDRAATTPEPVDTPAPAADGPADASVSGLPPGGEPRNQDLLPEREPEPEPEPEPTDLYAALAADPERGDPEWGDPDATVEFAVDRFAALLRPAVGNGGGFDTEPLFLLAEPPAAEPHRGRMRAAVLSGAAFAVFVLAGVAYASLQASSAPSALPPVPVQEPAVPSEPSPSFTAGVLPGVGVPSLSRRVSPPAGPGGTLSSAAGADGGVNGPGVTGPVPGWTGPGWDDRDHSGSGHPGGGTPQPVGTSGPGDPSDPGGGWYPGDGDPGTDPGTDPGSDGHATPSPAATTPSTPEPTAPGTPDPGTAPTLPTRPVVTASVGVEITSSAWSPESASPWAPVSGPTPGEPASGAPSAPDASGVVSASVVQPWDI